MGILANQAPLPSLPLAPEGREQGRIQDFGKGGGGGRGGPGNC